MQVKMKAKVQLSEFLHEMELQVGDRIVFVNHRPTYNEDVVLNPGDRVEVVPIESDSSVPF